MKLVEIKEDDGVVGGAWKKAYHLEKWKVEHVRSLKAGVVKGLDSWGNSLLHKHCLDILMMPFSWGVCRFSALKPLASVSLLRC